MNEPEFTCKLKGITPPPEPSEALYAGEMPDEFPDKMSPTTRKRLEYNAYKRTYYHKNPISQNTATKKWMQSHKEHLSAYNKKYRQENKDKVAAANKRYREKHPEKCKEIANKSAKKWYAKNKAKRQEYYLKKKAEKHLNQ